MTLWVVFGVDDDQFHGNDWLCGIYSTPEAARAALTLAGMTESGGRWRGRQDSEIYWEIQPAETDQPIEAV